MPPAEVSRITIVLADQQTIVRSAIRALLDQQPDLEVLAEAGNAEDATRSVLGHKPAVLVLDLHLPGKGGAETITDVRARSPQTQIVVLTARGETSYARQALQAGALGYVHKTAREPELLQAVRSAARGETYLNPALCAKVAAEAEPSGDDLTVREVEILRLIALGHTTPEIGVILVISPRTVEFHRARLRGKLGFGNRAALVRYALDFGLIGERPSGDS